MNNIFHFAFRSVVATEGQRVELKCYASGYPPPDIYWRRQDNALLPNNRFNIDLLLDTFVCVNTVHSLNVVLLKKAFFKIIFLFFEKRNIALPISGQNHKYGYQINE